MIIDYKQIEKIHFLNSEIDHEFNLNIIRTFEKLYFKTLEEKIDFIITGGLGSLLYYKKIYRTLKDIDLLIDTKDLTKWFKIFKYGYNFCYEDFYEENPGQRVKDFLNKKINSLILSDNEYKIKIEIINSELSKVLDYYEVNINAFTFKVKQSHFIYFNKLSFGRQKDFEDWQFFQQFLVDSK